MKLPPKALDELKQLYIDQGVELIDKELEEEGEDLLRLMALSRGVSFR